MASTITVRDMNQEIVRSCMEGLGPVSKSSLARKTGLSFPTVSKTVDLLCESGEVEVAGTEGSSGGRCAALYRLNPMYALYLLLAVENDSVHWKLKDLEGNSLTSGSTEGDGEVLAVLEKGGEHPAAVSQHERNCYRCGRHGFRRENSSVGRGMPAGGNRSSGVFFQPVRPSGTGDQ